MTAQSIALNRFGIGARPDQAPPADPRRWLLDQFDRFNPRPPAIAAVAGRREVAAQLADYLQEIRPALLAQRRAGPMPGARGMAMGADGMPAMAAEGAAADPVKSARQFVRGQGRDHYLVQVGARAQAALMSDTPFLERLAWFWSNHFAVSADKLTVVGLAGLLEFEAIRPNLLGRFGDMLNAVERHPAMLLYLDQAGSIGPNSLVADRVRRFRPERKLGLNENLAREILELHTLGVRTGYSQTDVTEFARAMTGWTVAGLTNGPLARFAGNVGAPGDFVFAAPIHEPGARTIMGKVYAQEGVAQAQAVLNDLATHPATARHIATKLARHFAGDTPPPALVARLEGDFLKTSGDLPSLYRTLIEAREAWVEAPAKFKTPWEWGVSATRALGARELPPPAVFGLMQQLGQPVWRPGAPAGYDDIAASWAGPDAVLRRVEAAERLATRAGAGVDARALAPKLFPGSLSPETSRVLASADSPGQALALLLVAPEMMRR
ncbi:MAG: hypothetical protein A4S12_08740 [Proteobacteria bacterium SG_bin5]|nr:DUF1800 domain-containing protein [Sphingomonas sp.]OQW41468.1 MAG: hypothetical protein A4S12_08740 [Proteobacteria bacterium SG_bin5]